MYHNKMLMTEVSSTKLQVVSYALVELAFLLPRASWTFRTVFFPACKAYLRNI